MTKKSKTASNNSDNSAVADEQSSDISEVEIQEFCSNSLAKFKIPEKIHFTDSLPRTATGKIQRRNVAKFFE